MSSTCDALASASTSISAPFSAQANSTSRVTRDGSNLEFNGESFRPVGPNIYWLGVAQDPEIAIPTHGQVLEALATASVMGANAVRAHTLGVSFGCKGCLLSNLGHYNSKAFDQIDFVIYAARAYGLKLVVPLVDQWDYYHGGIATFLRWRDKDASDHSPFYDLESEVHADWLSYVETLLNHTSSYTGVAMKDDPTILAFETGNELKNPPLDWTKAVSARLKELSEALVVDGQYGINKEVASVDAIDIVSDHFYPLFDGKLQADAHKAATMNKAFIAGEYDWTDQYSRLPLLAGLIPVVLVSDEVKHHSHPPILVDSLKGAIVGYAMLCAAPKMVWQNHPAPMSSPS